MTQMSVVLHVINTEQGIQDVKCSQYLESHVIMIPQD